MRSKNRRRNLFLNVSAEIGSFVEVLESRQLLVSVQVVGHTAIIAKYGAFPDSATLLGNSVGNEKLTTNRSGLYQNYRYGVIAWSAGTDAHEVHGAIYSQYNQMGGPNSSFGLPTTDETYTPIGYGRMSVFQRGIIVYDYTTGLTTAIPTIVPSIDILIPPKLREGDAFTVTAMDAIPGETINAQVIGNNDAIQYEFPITKIDSNGNATLALRMPYVLARGFTVDGRTLRVTTSGYTKDFHVTVNEGQRITLSADKIQEGKILTVTLKNGVRNSQVIFQLVRDNTEVVHEWGYMQTDSAGKGVYKLNIPTILSDGYQGSGYGLRVIHGGVVIDQKITITAGVRVELGAQNVRERISTFSMRVYNAASNTAVTLKWYAGITQRASQTFRTDGNGNGSFQVTTPTRLITNNANQDTFRLVVTVNGQPTTLTFMMLVYKYTQTSNTSPDPGGSQSLTIALSATKTNSTPGVTYNTPTVLGIKNVMVIYRQEKPAVGMDHQLVILCNGAGQHPGDNAGSSNPYDRPGMDLVYDKITGVTGNSHVMRLWSGDNFPLRNAMISADEATSLAKKSITDTINILNGLGQRIDSVVLAGYSWGGGMAKELANWITKTYHIEISALIYVDAVNHGSVGHQTSLPEKKPTSLMNIYQNIYSDIVDSVALGNGHIPDYNLPLCNGIDYYGRYLDADTDVYGFSMTDHTSIDNWAATGVAEFIDGVLNGWYGKHPS